MTSKQRNDKVVWIVCVVALFNLVLLTTPITDNNELPIKPQPVRLDLQRFSEAPNTSPLAWAPTKRPPPQYEAISTPAMRFDPIQPRTTQADTANLEAHSFDADLKSQRLVENTNSGEIKLQKIKVNWPQVRKSFEPDKTQRPNLVPDSRVQGPEKKTQENWTQAPSLSQTHKHQDPTSVPKSKSHWTHWGYSDKLQEPEKVSVGKTKKPNLNHEPNWDHFNHPLTDFGPFDNPNLMERFDPAKSLALKWEPYKPQTVAPDQSTKKANANSQSKRSQKPVSAIKHLQLSSGVDPKHFWSTFAGYLGAQNINRPDLYIASRYWLTTAPPVAPPVLPPATPAPTTTPCPPTEEPPVVITKVYRGYSHVCVCNYTR